MGYKIDMVDDTNYSPSKGTYRYTANIATGPIVLQISVDGGTTFQNMTNGSIAATEDKLIRFGDGDIVKATIPGGDSITLSQVDNGTY